MSDMLVKECEDCKMRYWFFSEIMDILNEISNPNITMFLDRYDLMWYKESTPLVEYRNVSYFDHYSKSEEFFHIRIVAPKIWVDNNDYLLNRFLKPRRNYAALAIKNSGDYKYIVDICILALDVNKDKPLLLQILKSVP